MADEPKKSTSTAAEVLRAMGAPPPRFPGEPPSTAPLDEQWRDYHARTKSMADAPRDKSSYEIPNEIEATLRKYIPEVVAFVSLEALAIPFFHAGAEAMLNGHLERGIIGYLVGAISAIAGFTFHWWKKWFSREVLERKILPWWPVLLLLAFVYVVGPELYRRATKPVALTGAIGEMPIGTIPAPQTAAPSKSADFDWNDPLVIESAFLLLPKPCIAKLTATTNKNVNTRNILSAILRRNGVCQVVDEQQDQVIHPIDVDAPTPTKISGLIVRWHPNFSEGRKTFQVLNGFLEAHEGHAMPKDAPLNLIWVQVGDGYPWKK